MKNVVKITRESNIPLIGCIQFGVIDRGSNLLQIRPTSVCNLNCVYCSTDSGMCAKKHSTDYIVELDYLIDYVKEIIDYKIEESKNKDLEIEANIDSVGEVMTYDDIFNLVEKLSKIKAINKISMQTNGTLLNKEKIKKLEELGVSQINLSINAIDINLAKELSGSDIYDLNHTKEVAKLIESSKITLLLAPVWIPNINDVEMPKLIQFAKSLCVKEQNNGKIFLGIQKFEIHKFGRKPKKSKEITYWKFYDKLTEWEKEFDVKLKIGPHDFKIIRTKLLPIKLDKNQKYDINIVAPGWMPNQMIGVANSRSITLVECNSEIGRTIKAKIIENKNNLYMAK